MIEGIFDWLIELISTEEQLDPSKVTIAVFLISAGAGLVTLIVGLLWRWMTFPRPVLRFSTRWVEKSPQSGAYKAYQYELVNAGPVRALNVKVTLSAPNDGVAGSTRAYIRTDDLNLQVETVCLEKDPIRFWVYFEHDRPGCNPHNPYADFRTKKLVLNAVYRNPPRGIIPKSKKHKIDKDVSRLPVG